MIKYNFKKINGENNLEIEGTHHHEWTSRLRFDRPHSSCRDEARSCAHHAAQRPRATGGQHG
jgi:hypothetical protein